MNNTERAVMAWALWRVMGTTSDKTLDPACGEIVRGLAPDDREQIVARLYAEAVARQGETTKPTDGTVDNDAHFADIEAKAKRAFAEAQAAAQATINALDDQSDPRGLVHDRWCNYMLSHGDVNCACDCGAAWKAELASLKAKHESYAVAYDAGANVQSMSIQWPNFGVWTSWSG
jgi:hypothetical protein